MVNIYYPQIATQLHGATTVIYIVAWHTLHPLPQHANFIIPLRFVSQFIFAITHMQ